jgi:hypothetical protein
VCPALRELGQVLFPFPSMVLTPTKLHQVPIVSQDGKVLDEMEFRQLAERLGIFQRDLSSLDAALAGEITAKVGNVSKPE